MILPSQPVIFKPLFNYDGSQFIVEQIHICLVSPDWTISQFINTVKPLLAQGFNLDDTVLFDIVECGQEDLINNTYSNAEDAPKLKESDTKVSEKWGENVNVTFYVRPRQC